MERIKQALERARQEREAAGVFRTPLSPAREARTAVDVAYSQTRVCKVDSALLRANRVVCGDANDEAMAAYKMLRTQVLQRMAAKGWRALAVTSPAPSQGKTLTSINLAVSIARAMDHTVLLADLDLRRPSIHTYFSYSPAYGIDDYLLNDTPLSEILFNPGIERLVILPSKEPVSDSSELLSSPKMLRLVEELKTRYPSRFVIFDLLPVLSSDDTLAFAPNVDAMLMVVEDGKTKKEELKQAMGLLDGTNVLGTVLNKSDEKMGTYY